MRPIFSGSRGTVSKQQAYVQIFDGADKPLRMEKWPLPESLDEGEVLVKIDLATICGSDLHTLSGHRSEKTPCVLGHEAVGRVVRLDKARAELAPGDRITWSIADSCGHCAPCIEYHLPQKCDALFKYGHAPNDDGTGLNGCYSSHIVLRQGTHIVKVSDQLVDAVVAPANCALATMFHAVSRLPKNCRAVVIQGAGLLGLYACAILNERGVNHIFCVDIQERRLELVTQFGGIAIDGRSHKYAHSRQQITAVAPRGVDAVIEVAGVAELVQEGIRLLRPGGYYGLVGMVHPDSQLGLTGEQVIRKCLTLYGIHNYGPEHLEQAVQFLEQTVDTYPYESLVSAPVPLQQLAQGIELAKTQQWSRVSVQAEQ
jgi:putative phosphonate catabolism associated alcohol dehydrogenase